MNDEIGDLQCSFRTTKRKRKLNRIKWSDGGLCTTYSITLYIQKYRSRIDMHVAQESAWILSVRIKRSMIPMRS